MMSSSHQRPSASSTTRFHTRPRTGPEQQDLSLGAVNGGGDMSVSSLSPLYSAVSGGPPLDVSTSLLRSVEFNKVPASNWSRLVASDARNELLVARDNRSPPWVDARLPRGEV